MRPKRTKHSERQKSTSLRSRLTDLLGNSKHGAACEVGCLGDVVSFFYVPIALGSASRAVRPPCKAAKQSAFRSYYCTEDGETVPEEKTETDERCRVVGVVATQTADKICNLTIK